MRRYLVVAAATATLCGSAPAPCAAGQTRPPAAPAPRGLAGLLAPADSGAEWQAPPGPKPSPGADGAGRGTEPAPTRSPTAREAALNRAIAALATQLDLSTGVTRETVDVGDDLATLEAMADEFRQRYLQMRDRLYVGDPARESAAARAFAAFDAAWGSLALKIWDGDRTVARVAVREWNAVRPRLERLGCSNGATLPALVADGTLDGAAWACVVDGYVADLADHEVRVNRAQAVARERALAPLAEALDELDTWMAGTAGLRRAAPDNPTLRRELTWRLLAAWRAGARARHDELVRLRDVDPESPFQRMAALAPEIPRPRLDGAAVLVLPAGRTLRVRLGSAETAAAVVDRPYDAGGSGLVRELHDVHYLLRTLDEFLTAKDRDDVRDAGDDGAARAAQLAASRDARLADARRTLRERQARLVRRLAGT